ncbi:GH25 family lysozyme [Kutzneria sp. NPDC051319]|uniref:glycoside hydrolase family 25 protein n=1 Tax=Kutzneria sp. NPDC051319 TaxID=3155047 RepID=UPI003432D44E
MADYGIDVSSFNTITSWPDVRAGGNAWAWAKATQGSGYTNPLFGGQFAGSSAAGLITGAYHFADPNPGVPANVDHFVTVASPVGAFADGAMVPLLDIENDPADGVNWTADSANAFIAAFRDALRIATGQPKLCVYASQSWWLGGMLRPDDWADDNVYLCAARFGVDPGDVGWAHPRLAAHQYTNEAPTPGSAGPTDRSVTIGTFDAAALTI